MATHRQVVPGHNGFAYDVLLCADRLLVLELLRVGYSPSMLAKIWAAIPPARTDPATVQVRTELKQVRKWDNTEAAKFLVLKFPQEVPLKLNRQ